MPAWQCSVCDYAWPVTIDPATGKERIPEQCMNKKCRSRKWNSGKEIIPQSGEFGGRPTEPYAKQFRRLRKKMNIPQVKLGDLIGISQRQVANIEGGKSEPSMKTSSMFNALYARHMENRVNG